MRSNLILAGPDPATGMEHADSHRRRLGSLPAAGAELIAAVASSGLRGRGGASFPVATKWSAVAKRSRGRAVVLANGAEGEPLSQKDRVVMGTRPHLVLDGALLAAGAVGARRVVLYVGAPHTAAAGALRAAVSERPPAEQRRIAMVTSPPRYVAGEESAAVHFVNDGVALPTTVPPRPFERGVDGRPTLVHNVETLAAIALIARYGGDWYRTVATTLITVSGSVATPGVIEVQAGTTISDAVTASGGILTGSRAVLLGGYFGGWVPAQEAWTLPLDSAALKSAGRSMGCGVVHVLAEDRCGVTETARVLTWLAGESARQCGPCVFGLHAIAQVAERIARTASSDVEDLTRLQRWSQQLRGRGACRHPDGAAGFLLSALQVFSDEFALHHEHRRCSVLVPA